MNRISKTERVTGDNTTTELPVPSYFGMDRYRAQVIILQSLVSIVLSYQVLVTSETVLARPVQEILVLGLSSLVAAALLLPSRLVETRAFTIILLLIDTTVTSSIIYMTEQRGSDLYLAYFLIILISASMRTLRQKTGFSALIAVTYATTLYATLGDELFIEGHLVRISILLIMGVVYSVMSYNLELERHDRIVLEEEINERLRAEEKLKASEALLRTLYEITVQADDWESRLRRMLQIACASLGMSCAHLMRITGDKYELRMIIGEGAGGRPGDTYPLESSYCGWTIESREPVTFYKPVKLDWKPPSNDPLLSPQAFAGITILVDGAIYGALCFSSSASRRQAFAGYEKVFLTLCAQWIGHEIEREAADKDIHVAMEQAETANRAKSEFLATMSHEIRTPMNAIVGMADLLGETDLSSTQKEYLGALSRSTAHLLDLIDDILDLSKVEAGLVQLEEVSFDLNGILDRCTEALTLRTQAKHLELIASIAPDVPTELIGDPRALRQVIWNLLGNAIKFTERGEVCLRVSKDLSMNQAGALRFAISDTGIGIPPEKHSVIFERFTQADSSTTRLYGGTGLGLAISKHLIELAGGRIWLESYVGKGTTFYFTMPFGIGRGVTDSPSRIDLSGSRIHLQISHAETRETVREFFIAKQATVTQSADLQSTTTLLHEATLTHNPYRFVVLDLGNIDVERSPEYCQLITYARDCGTMIIVIVPDVRSSVIASFYRLGLGAYVTKPITSRKLEQVFLRCINNQPSHQPQVENKKENGLAILMAEDSVDNQRLVQAYLKQTSHRLEIAENGRAAYEMFRNGNYDLVLMDLQMPVMDGLTATAMIREWEKESHRATVPIIALTAHAYEERARESLAVGCSAHLTKPVRKATLLAEIQKYLAPSPHKHGNQ